MSLYDVELYEIDGLTLSASLWRVSTWRANTLWYTWQEQSFSRKCHQFHAGPHRSGFSLPLGEEGLWRIRGEWENQVHVISCQLCQPYHKQDPGSLWGLRHEQRWTLKENLQGFSGNTDRVKSSWVIIDHDVNQGKRRRFVLDKDSKHQTQSKRDPYYD